MIARTSNLKVVILRATGFIVARWATLSAGVGALGGATYGIVFAGCMMLLRIESYSFIEVVAYFTLCGVAAGALVGACGGLLEGETIPESPEFGSQTTDAAISRNAMVPPIVSREELSPRNRLAGLFRGDRKTAPPYKEWDE